MDTREQASEHARRFFDDLWQQGDYWKLETSDFERAKYERQIEMLSDRRYARALEIGCGAGVFTRMLAPLCDYILAVDVAPAAIERAKSAPGPVGVVEYSVANIMERNLRQDAPWDLVVMSETVYYLGWLYSFFDVGWLAQELSNATGATGRLLMANTLGPYDHLLLPPLIRTYRDLFVNVGYGVEREELFHGEKKGVGIDTLIVRFGKPE